MVGDVASFDNHMKVSMPITRPTGNFKDESSAEDVLLPESALTKFTKGANEVREHDREIRFVPEGESEMLETITARRSQ